MHRDVENKLEWFVELINIIMIKFWYFIFFIHC